MTLGVLKLSFLSSKSGRKEKNVLLIKISGPESYRLPIGNQVLGTQSAPLAREPCMQKEDV